VIACACNDTTGLRCQYHSREPKPCQHCKSGTLQRYAPHKREGSAIVPCFNRETSRIVMLPSSRPIWTCNFCEHCEIEK
jgi:hypothetical protein